MRIPLVAEFVTSSRKQPEGRQKALRTLRERKGIRGFREQPGGEMAFGTKYSLKVTGIAALAAAIGMVASLLGFIAERKRINVCQRLYAHYLSIAVFLRCFHAIW